MAERSRLLSGCSGENWDPGFKSLPLRCFTLCEKLLTRNGDKFSQYLEKKQRTPMRFRPNRSKYIVVLPYAKNY